MGVSELLGGTALVQRCLKQL